jgi:glycosyltransferase involved in cell wall biosynthesis
MAASDVFLFPSLRDGGGTVVIEAMGVGKPVICLDTGGPGMHIDQQCGVKIVPQSPAQAISEMASALERLCRDENLRVKLGQAAKQKVVDLYLWEKLGDKLNKIYERALGAQETNESD